MLGNSLCGVVCTCFDVVVRLAGAYAKKEHIRFDFVECRDPAKRSAPSFSLFCNADDVRTRLCHPLRLCRVPGQSPPPLHPLLHYVDGRKWLCPVHYVDGRKVLRLDEVPAERCKAENFVPADDKVECLDICFSITCMGSSIHVVD
jgi:hypothetical protein